MFNGLRSDDLKTEMSEKRTNRWVGGAEFAQDDLFSWFPGEAAY
jgi:hypothetical protein